MTQIDPIVRIATATNGRFDRWDEHLRDSLMSMKFVDKATGPDVMTLQFDDPDLEFRNDERFSVGSKIAVLFGYPGNTFGHGPVVFQVKTVKGFRVLTVEGPTVEAATFLGRERTRTWEDATEFEIAEEIARDRGFSSEDDREIDSGDYAIIRRGITQAGETDMAFLRRIAARVDCVCYMSGGVFHFHPPRYDGTPGKLLTYFTSDRGEFTSDPDIEIAPLGRPGRVTRRGVSTRERADVTGTAGNDDDPGRVVNGQELVVGDPQSWEALVGLTAEERAQVDVEVQSSEMVRPTTGDSDDAAQRAARRAFRGSERETVKLNASLVGDPELIAGETVRIDGLGPQLSGNYFIEEAEHQISKGYDSRIKTKRNALGASGANSSRRRQERNAPTNDIADRDSGPQTYEPVLWERVLNVDPNARVNDSYPQTRRPVMWEDILSDEEIAE